MEAWVNYFDSKTKRGRWSLAEVTERPFRKLRSQEGLSESSISIRH